MFGFLADSRFGPISSLALSMLLMCVRLIARGTPLTAPQGRKHPRHLERLRQSRCADLLPDQCVAAAALQRCSLTPSSCSQWCSSRCAALADADRQRIPVRRPGDGRRACGHACLEAARLTARPQTMSMLTMSRAIGSGVGSPAAGYLLDVSRAVCELRAVTDDWLPGIRRRGVGHEGIPTRPAAGRQCLAPERRLRVHAALAPRRAGPQEARVRKQGEGHVRGLP
jgi:hypothetical protein